MNPLLAALGENKSRWSLNPSELSVLQNKYHRPDRRRDVDKATALGNQSRGYPIAAPYLILWGVIWIVGYDAAALSAAMPTGRLWLVLDVVGLLGSGVIASRERGKSSRQGASAALLVALLQRRATMLLSVALVLEYETTCMLAEHRLVAGASVNDVQNMIDAFVNVSEPVEVHYQWRPQLTDAGDEMVLEAAVNGQANAIVTFNRKDYGSGPSRFGIEILSPAEALGRICK